MLLFIKYRYTVVYIYSTNCDQLTLWLRSPERKCLHLDEANTITFYRKIATFEAVCIYMYLWPRLVTMGYPCSAAMSHYITQPCVLATFSCGLRFATVALGSF